MSYTMLFCLIPQPLGKITHYFWCNEFQARGSPHIHPLWWVENAPDISTEEGKAAAPDFIDEYVTTKLPTVEEDDLLHRCVSTLQVHEHKDTCTRLKKGKEICRFDFPQPASQHTYIKKVWTFLKAKNAVS